MSFDCYNHPSRYFYYLYLIEAQNPYEYISKHWSGAQNYSKATLESGPAGMPFQHFHAFPRNSSIHDYGDGKGRKQALEGEEQSLEIYPIRTLYSVLSWNSERELEVTLEGGFWVNVQEGHNCGLGKSNGWPESASALSGEDIWRRAPLQSLYFSWAHGHPATDYVPSIPWS